MQSSRTKSFAFTILLAEAALVIASGEALASVVSPTTYESNSGYTMSSSTQGIVVDFDSAVTSGSGLPRYSNGSSGNTSANVITIGSSDHVSEWFGSSTSYLDDQALTLGQIAIEERNLPSTCDTIWAFDLNGKLHKGLFSGSCLSASVPPTWTTESPAALDAYGGLSIAAGQSSSTVIATDGTENCGEWSDDFVYLLASDASHWIKQSGLCGHFVAVVNFTYYVAQHYDLGGPGASDQIASFSPGSSGSPSSTTVGVGTVGEYVITAFTLLGDTYGGLAYLTAETGPNGSNLWVSNWNSFESQNIDFGATTLIDSISFDSVQYSGLYMVKSGDSKILKLGVQALDNATGYLL